MDEEALNALLTQSRTDISPDAEVTARAVARKVVSRELGQRGPVRPRWTAKRLLLPAGVAVLALTAAGTVAASQLSLPPFQTTEPGIQRVGRAVPVDYQLTSGGRVSCDAFVETRRASSGQLGRIEKMIASTDWSGYGQRTYAALPPAAQAVKDAPGPVGDVVLNDLKRRALAVAPGTDVTGGAISCSYGSRTDAPQ